PRSTRLVTLFPYTTLFRSPLLPRRTPQPHFAPAARHRHAARGRDRRRRAGHLALGVVAGGAARRLPARVGGTFLLRGQLAGHFPLSALQPAWGLLPAGRGDH